MRKQLFRYWYTLRYLTLEQVFFQVWYRVKRKLPRKPYLQYTLVKTKTIACRNYDLVVSANKYKGNNTFTFLNITHSFGPTIDWKIQQYGKLWNYNLQYFDYVLDDSIDAVHSQALMNEYATLINNGSIALEPYPTSLRLVNWIIYCGKHQFHSVVVDQSIKKQIAFLEDHIEYHIQANHLLENYVALVISFCYLNDANKLSTYYRHLEKQVAAQVLADGGHYECSPMYHCIILSKLLLVIDILELHPSHNIDIVFLKERAAIMLGWINRFSFSDGSIAHFNDSVDGISVPISVLKEAGKKIGIKPRSVVLSASGFRKFEYPHFELLVDVGAIMPTYQPGHAHSDMLSFCLSAFDKPIVVDTGVSTYESNVLRFEERSTPAHNTVHVNEDNQSDVWSSFRVGKRAAISIIEDEPDKVTAKHDGYLRKYGVAHQRTFYCTSDAIQIADSLIGNRKSFSHALASFHLHPSIDAFIDGHTVKVASAAVQFKFEGAVEVTLSSYSYAAGFNLRKTAKRIDVRFSQSLATSILLN